MIQTQSKDRPFVFYINLEKDKERKKITESQLKKFKRVEAITTKQVDNLLLSKPPYLADVEIACTLSHLKAIEEFYNSDLEYAIIAEDDVDFSIEKYWGFDWKFLLDKIPKNYDVLQLVIICDKIYFKIHNHFVDEYSTAAYLINRRYAEKLLSLHKKENKYDLANTLPRATAEDVIYNSGVTYSMPLLLYREDAFKVSNIQNNDDIKKFHEINYYKQLTLWKTKAKFIDWEYAFKLNPYFGTLIRPWRNDNTELYPDYFWIPEVFGKTNSANQLDLDFYLGDNT